MPKFCLYTSQIVDARSLVHHTGDKIMRTIIKVIFLSLLICSSCALAKQNIIETMNSEKNLSTLVKLIEIAGLTEDLERSKSITLFAPTDSAFKELPQSTINNLMQNPAELEILLKYHTSPNKLHLKKIMSLNEIKTLAGSTIGLYKNNDLLRLNQSTEITQSNLSASNGVIHKIDGILGFDESTPKNNIETVDYVDLEKYLGDWYEIARYKNNFQTECLGTKANYSLNWAGYIRVRNTCQLEDKTNKVGNALATVRNKKTNAELSVSFVPVLNWLGLFAGDYNILHLGPDYDYALVGDKKRSNFWILARTKEIPEALYQELLDIAVEKGFRKDLIFRSQIFR